MFSLEPSALMTRFWKAAAGLKNMCANLDQYTEPKSSVVKATNNTKNRLFNAPAPMEKDQSSAKVAMPSRPMMKRSPRPFSWYHLTPSELTSTRMLNQNQYPPRHSMAAP